ncbi:MAG: hypothetical protein P0S93_02700 [Candidatus Neptunochlamydia sp.]|nr:hypothetical protein [Candidatus Neptunochlamydia sp.]
MHYRKKRAKGQVNYHNKWTGKIVNYIAALNPTKKIYGFDSFEGFPEDWVKEDRVVLKENILAFNTP